MHKFKKGDVLKVFNSEGKAVLAVYNGFMVKSNHHQVKVRVGIGKNSRDAIWYLSDSRIAR